MLNTKLLYDPYALGLEVSGKSRGEYICRCPFHNDRHPTGACFNPSNGWFYCFVCGAKAHAEQLAVALGGICSRVQALPDDEEEMDWSGVLRAPLAYDHEYLKKRKVSNEQVEKFQIKKIPQGIVFPIKNTKDQEVGCLIRNIDRSVRYISLGEKPALWNLNNLANHKHGNRVWVTEGVFGSLRADSAGIFAVATMTSKIQRDGSKFLNHFPTFVLYDNDYAGYLGGALFLREMPRAHIVVPGREADELSIDEWKELDNAPTWTNNIIMLAKFSKDPKKLIQQLRKDYESGLRKSYR